MFRCGRELALSDCIPNIRIFGKIPIFVNGRASSVATLEIAEPYIVHMRTVDLASIYGFRYVRIVPQITELVEFSRCQCDLQQQLQKRRRNCDFASSVER